MPTLEEILDAIGHARVFSTRNFEVWVPPHTYQGSGQMTSSTSMLQCKCMTNTYIECLND
jgi:hypothetical protein